MLTLLKENLDREIVKNIINFTYKSFVLCSEVYIVIFECIGHILP